MPYAVIFQLRKKLSGALFVEMLDSAPAAGGDNLEFLRMNFEKPRHEWASAAFKMAKHTDFVGKALLGLRPAEGFMDTPVVADAHLCPQRILDLVHAAQTWPTRRSKQAPKQHLRQLAFPRSRKSCVAGCLG